MRPGSQGAVRRQGLGGYDPGSSTGDGSKAIYNVKLKAKPHGAEREKCQECNSRRKN